MNNKRFVLSALTVGAAMLVGCPGPAATPDGGTDTGPATPDMGPRDTGPVTPDMGPHDGGTDGGPMAPDANVPLTCAGLCAQITSACTGTAPATNANPYGNMATCMTDCTTDMWPVGTTADTSGNTLGCRVYHSIVAGMSPTNAMTHCPHTGVLGGGVCSPFRTDAATEVTVTGTAHPAGYLRVDRMGMPAVSTALIPAANKNAYNDGGPNDDASLTFGTLALGTLVGLHNALDAQLRAAPLHMTPCSTRFTPFPGVATGVPYCAAQGFDGNPAHPVAGLILPDTLRLDPTIPAQFPNGRTMTDPVIDITLGVLLLSTEHVCDPDRVCSTMSLVNCALPTSGCQVQGTACVNVDCESRTAATCTTAGPGCQPNICGAGTTPCNAGTLAAAHLSQGTNDATPLTTFPYFAAPH